MKRVFSCVVAASLALSLLVGCGASSTASSAASSAASSEAASSVASSQTKRSMKVLYTALLALLLFPSCRRQSGDIDSFLHNAESLMNEHPEDALSIIRHIDRRKIYSSASEARYALLYSQ